MATNKFATMLHRNTHKLNVILVYAVLEWILIFLLLLNSLFSYLISKFARYFGLKPPCHLCSRFDHLLDSKKTTKDSYLDLVCEEHANEISRLSYRSNRCEIQDSELICTNFSSFDLEISPKIDFFTWVGDNGSENSFVLLDYTQKMNLIEEIVEKKEEFVDDYEHHIVSDDVESFSFGPTMEEDCSMSLMNFKCDERKEKTQLLCDRDDESIEVVMNSCWIDYCDIDRLVPVIDSSTIESQRSHALQASSKDSEEEPGYKHSSEEMEFKMPVPTKVCGDEITDQDQVEGLATQLPLQVGESFIRNEEGSFSRIDESIVDKDQSQKLLEEAIIEERSFMEVNNKKLPLFEISETEYDSEDGALIIERLRSALRDEKKALNESMAMITRLQEEKAEIEMEASQYQRMMEEQAEYDQEALQLLNELMLKREKEKQELENELEFYRKKVLDKPVMMRKKSGSSRSKNSSASSSNVEDSEEILSDSSPIVDEGVDCEHTVHDSTMHLSALDESLLEFEEERMSILEELKALEEKLITLADDEERPFEHFTLNLEPNEHSQHDYIYELGEDYTLTSVEESVVSSGFSREQNGKMDYSAAKRLLPLFDEEEVKSHSEKRSMFIDEEVDHVYERLMDLEADKEFLKHSISSLKKGDKGMNVLEQILQNLRDLRSVELRMRSISDGSNACSSI